MLILKLNRIYESRVRQDKKNRKHKKKREKLISNVFWFRKFENSGQIIPFGILAKSQVLPNGK
jgi:hypothetical protein